MSHVWKGHGIKVEKTASKKSLTKLDFNERQMNSDEMHIVIFSEEVSASKKFWEALLAVTTENYKRSNMVPLDTTIVVDETKYALNYFDLSGSEHFPSQRDMFIKSSHGFILLYSVTSRSSYEQISSFHELIRNQLSIEIFPIILVGNCSHPSSERQVSTEEAAEFARKSNWKFLEVFETDVSTITQAYSDLVRSIRDYSICCHMLYTQANKNKSVKVASPRFGLFKKDSSKKSMKSSMNTKICERDLKDSEQMEREKAVVEEYDKTEKVDTKIDKDSVKKSTSAPESLSRKLSVDNPLRSSADSKKIGNGQLK